MKTTHHEETGMADNRASEDEPLAWLARHKLDAEQTATAPPADTS
jgi:hypothetical protein